jgi:hypothetical protein
MQPKRLTAAATLAAALSLTVFAPGAAHAGDATTRCASPASPIDRVACDKARQGPDTLRRFVQRTQPTMMLNFWDYMSPAELEKYYAQQPGQKREQAAERRDKAG